MLRMTEQEGRTWEQSTMHRNNKRTQKSNTAFMLIFLLKKMLPEIS